MLVVGADYGDLEARILAWAKVPSIIGIELDMREASGQIFGPYGIYERPAPRPEPVKQNGRSASYLDHDPSKRHKGRGRRRR